MNAVRYSFIEESGEPHPVYVIDSRTGQRYHLVPLSEVAPNPRHVPDRFANRCHQRQTCKVCGLPSEICFHVPDDVWSAVVPLHLQGFVVCLTCFDIMAKKSDIAYADKLCREAYFVGERGGFTFHVAHRMDY